MSDEHALPQVTPEHFVFGNVLAAGGMGRIRAARDRRLGRDVAIKELIAGDAQARARFEREARITARLQHPSIISVLEAGRWPSGESFYVMRWLAGRSLATAIAAAPGPRERLALLPSVLAAADAVAYAHRQRIIHRDLKPANVLLGDFGETIVLDWGLAKDLDDPSRDVVAEGPRHGDAMQTIAGAILGTPAYMPPEQARGETVDERADVYALGALLYEVLAGAAPYAGGLEEVLARVAAQPPAELAALAPRVPTELVTIVRRAMARAPRDRYPDAGALAADLRAFLDGRLLAGHRYSTVELIDRWARRYRAPLAILGLALVALIGLGAVSARRDARERRAADAQRVLADQTREQAEVFVSYLLGELYGKLAEVGRHDLLQAVLDATRRYYERRPEAESDATLGRRAAIAEMSAEVLGRHGDPTAAIEQLRSGIALLARADVLRGRALSGDRLWRHAELADQLLDLGRTADAERAIVEVQPAAEAAMRAAPRDGWLVSAVAQLENQRGRVALDEERPADAVPHLRRAIALRTQAIALLPKDPEEPRNLSIDHHLLGQALVDAGQLQEGLAEEQLDLAFSQQEVDRDPRSVPARRDLATSTSFVGGTLVKLGRTREGLAHLSRAIELERAVRRVEPDEVSTYVEEAQAHESSAEAMLALHDRVAARAALDRAIGLFERLLARPAPVGLWRRWLSQDLARRAVLDLERATPPGARADLRRALSLIDADGRELPQSAAALRALAATLADEKRARALEGQPGAGR